MKSKAFFNSVDFSIDYNIFLRCSLEPFVFSPQITDKAVFLFVLFELRSVILLWSKHWYMKNGINCFENLS